MFLKPNFLLINLIIFFEWVTVFLSSILSNIMEALIGSIFLDSDYSNTRKVVLNLWKEMLSFEKANNLFNSKYVSYGGYYTYDVPTDNQIKTYEGTYYYPQAEINILVGLDFKF